MNRCGPFIVASSVVAMCAASAQAQTAANAAITADDLKAPSTPAVTILGSSPTSIARPDTPRALVMSVVSSVSDANGVPKGYAAQIAPYWMRSHPTLVFDSYVRPRVKDSIARTFAVSVATDDWTTGSGKDTTDLGSRFAIGLNTVVFPGRVHAALTDLRDQIIKSDQQLIVLLRGQGADPRVVALKARVDELRKKLQTEKDAARLVELSRDLAETTSAIDAIAVDMDQQIAKLEQSIKKMTLQMQQLNVQRYGPRLALAGAWSARVPNDVFGSLRAERSGFWLTPSYRTRLTTNGASAGDADEPKAQSIDTLGVVRYLRDRVEGTDAWDAGGRLVLEVSSNVAVSGEALRRWHRGPSRNADSYRAVGVFEVRVGDKAFLFASFGRDFTDVEKERTLVSLFGVNLGFGDKPIVGLQQAQK